MLFIYVFFFNLIKLYSTISSPSTQPKSRSEQWKNDNQTSLNRNIVSTFEVYENMANDNSFVKLEKEREIYSVPPISYEDISYHNSYEIVSANQDPTITQGQNIPTIVIQQFETRDGFPTEMQNDEAIVYADIRDEQEISHLYSIVRKIKK